MPVQSHPPQDPPEEYQALTKDAELEPLVIRFQPGVSELNSKALDDIDRIVAFVSSPPYSGQKILLLGFADSLGSSTKSLELSKNRARSVAEEFRKRRLPTSVVTGFGSESGAVE